MVIGIELFFGSAVGVIAFLFPRKAGILRRRGQ
jgi:hypothetical protein